MIKAPVVVTNTKERVEVCKSLRMLHVLDASGVCLCYTKLVRRDGMEKVFNFGSKSVAFLQIQRYAGCIEC